MRDALFIIAVAIILFGLTAIRYRKQIVSVIRFTRMVREVQKRPPEIPPARSRKDPLAAEPLVKCSGCGTWTPENRARRLRTGDFFCSKECLESKARS